MKNKLLLILSIFLLPVFVFAQVVNTIQVPVAPASRDAVIAKKKAKALSKSEQKFQSCILELQEQYKANGNTLQHKKGVNPQSVAVNMQYSLAKVDRTDKVYVYIQSSKGIDAAKLVSALKKKGIAVDVWNKKFPLVQVWMPISKIKTIGAMTEVASVSVVTEGVQDTGPTLSAGVPRHRADVAQNLLNATGAGIKIGVMSDDCGSTEGLLANSITTGELKNTATFLAGKDNSGGRTHEGLAMMEIVQDMAPQADLVFATASGGIVNYSNNIYALRAAGCKIITDDVFNFGEPVYEDGLLAQTVEDVTHNFGAGNVVYTCSAGNAAQLSLFSNYVNQVSTLAGVAGQNVNNFGGGVFLNAVNIGGGGTATVALQWDDKFGASGNDFDVYLVNAGNTAIVASSTGSQTGTQDPFEIFSYTNPSGSTQTFNIVIVKFSAATNATPRFRLECRGNVSQMQFNSPVSTIYGHHGALTAVSTGAADASGNNYNTIEAYSSQGPQLIYNTSAAAPRPLIETRIKPDLFCTDGVQTSVAGFQPFFGTSAAAPHSAGIAGQIWSAFPSLNAAQVRAALVSGCVDYLAAGSDNISGAGRSDVVKAIALQRAASTPNTWASAFTTPSLAITDNNAAGVNSTLSVSAPCSSISPDSVYVSVTIDGHNKTGDLKITLKSPDNTTITLMDRPVSGAGTGTGKNMNVVLGDVASTSIQTANPAGNEELGFYIPVNVISSNSGFRGHAIGGTWTLNVSDNAAGNTGILKDWGLMMKEGVPTPPTLIINWNPPFIFPNDHTLRNITVSNSFVGGCTPALVLLSITSNEPDAGTGGGDVAGDIQGASFGTNDLAFQLRSECSPDAPFGKGRYYTTTYRFTDVGGFQRDTIIAIPVLCTPGRVDPFTTVAAATGSVTMDIAPSPSPLVTTSKINYTITGASSAEVLLTISNNMGKWVRNFDYGVKAPGTYSLTFNGNAADGTPLPNGVYAYQLAVGAPYNSLNTGVVIINRGPPSSAEQSSISH